jgi:hypothetical protein
MDDDLNALLVRARLAGATNLGWCQRVAALVQDVRDGERVEHVTHYTWLMMLENHVAELEKKSGR